MTDRPILFNAPMVRALLEGRKTQTRLIAKITAIMGNRVSVFPPEELIELEEGEFRRGVMHYASTGALSGPYPVGYAVGDRLWVREAWRAQDCYDDLAPSQFGGEEGVRYEADGVFGAWTFGPRKAGRYRDARYMPRWASRLTLTVTDVRVQRLQDISAADCRAEGHQTIPWMSADPQVHDDAARDWYMDLWNSLNGPGAWEANPWVVALTFDVEQRNIDQVRARA